MNYPNVSNRSIIREMDSTELELLIKFLESPDSYPDLKSEFKKFSNFDLGDAYKEYNRLTGNFSKS